MVGAAPGPVKASSLGVEKSGSRIEMEQERKTEIVSLKEKGMWGEMIDKDIVSFKEKDDMMMIC